MNPNTTNKKITLKERKKAQPKAVIYFSEAEKATIRETVGKNLTDPQFKIFLYTTQALGLNPLLNEIACITYRDKEGKTTMSIQVMRDGFLTIAHRSGKFAGLESGVKLSDDGMRLESGWARVWHKDFKEPVYQEADFNEYNTNRNLWVTKPKTMIKKVAESMALRKAFNINGVYAPEEMEREINQEPSKQLSVKNGDYPATDEQITTLRSLDPKLEIDPDMTKQQASELIYDRIMKKK